MKPDLGDIVNTVARAGQTVIGVKVKYALYAAAWLGWSAVVAAGATTLVRNHYKAGQVDALRVENEALQRSATLSGDFAEFVLASEKITREDLSKLQIEYVALAGRDPIVLKEIQKEYLDAPNTYADFDPKRCLAYIPPDGMQKRAEGRIARHLATLPAFDGSGRRILQPATGGDGAGSGPDDIAALRRAGSVDTELQQSTGLERLAGGSYPQD